MPTRHGKIARLPLDIREQLNNRLFNGETLASLASWLNALPAVQAVLADRFGSIPVSEQNLSNWREGGFVEWLTLQNREHACRSLVEEAAQIAGTGFDTGKLLLVLTADLAASLRGSESADGELTPVQKALQKLIATVLLVQQAELKAARLTLDRERRSGNQQPCPPATAPMPPKYGTPEPPLAPIPLAASETPAPLPVKSTPAPAAPVTSDADIEAAFEARLKADLGPASYARFSAALRKDRSAQPTPLSGQISPLAA